jgi:hypothetical protein
MKRPLSMLLMFAACTGGPDAGTSGLIDRDRFTQLLLEAQLIEARVNHELVVEHITSIPMEQYYTELFEASNVTREDFDRTYAYYAQRPAELKAIYEEILTELARRKDQPPQ